MDTVTINEEGYGSSKHLPLGDYTVREKKAPMGFLRCPDVFEVTLGYAGQDAEISYGSWDVQEMPQQGKISIKKTSGNTLVDTVTTNAGGNAQSMALNLGSYIVKEKTAPSGFVRNPSSFTAVLEYAGQDVEFAVASVTVPEQPQAGVIRVAKNLFSILPKAKSL